jgi:transcriptional regulator with XRE-family HTH domain
VKFSSSKLKRLVEADKRMGKDIAAEGGFSVASVSHWALGRRVPGADELAALAKVFGVPIDYFFEGEGTLVLREDQIPYQAKSEIKTDDISKLRRQVVILKGAVQQIELTLERLEK